MSLLQENSRSKAENCWSKAKARYEISKKAEVTEIVLQINGTKSES
jgi:hypothetical protein